MFDLAWSHILLIGVVALLVIGPKDLPRVLRTLGIWVGRARAIARDFQGNLDQMIREAELEEVRKEVEQATTVDLDRHFENTIDPGGELKQAIAEPADTAPAGSEPPSGPAIEAQPTESVAALPGTVADAPASVTPPEAGEPGAEAATAPAAAPKSGTHD
ncbi:MAG TPA: Sec-independent protein translocase protein TatB [Stellaceae bacterium]|nr:Sec-independent protein translocase protein TatB [Stellaceae bacterium]